MKKLKELLCPIIAILILPITCSLVQGNSDQGFANGMIKGQVVDAQTQSPLGGASIIILGSQQGVAADPEGRYLIRNLPAGSLKVKFSCIGYETLVKPDIIIRPGRTTFIRAELSIKPLETEDVVVRADYFPETAEAPTSVTAFSGEEIRRSPGSAGDVSRIVSILPSAAKINDQLNCLAIRGGTPAENSFYLDNIEIPNINHYPLQGSSGGPIGLLNVDFVQEVNFSAGGFSAIYGDRLSSVMDISFREGDREQYGGQVELDLSGFGLIAEGPIAKEKSSWMLSVRRSYLDLLAHAVGLGVAPRYNDFQGKLVYDLSAHNKISILGVAGVDFIDFTKRQSQIDGNPSYGNYRGHEHVIGMNWLHLWSNKGYSETSVSMLGSKLDVNFHETKSGKILDDGSIIEQSYQFRNVTHYRISDYVHVQMGVEEKYIVSQWNLYAGGYTDLIGNPTAGGLMDERVESSKIGIFADMTLMLLRKLTATLGLRFDRFAYNQQAHFSPRLSLSWKASSRISLSVSTGVYYQNLPLALLTPDTSSKRLKDPVAYHAILGLTYLLSENTRLTLESYYKKYDHFPLDARQPQISFADKATSSYYFAVIEDVADKGRAESYGIEATLQKKLAQSLYGILCGSYSRARYEGLDGVWRNRDFDNRLIFGIEGGFKPNNKWEFSLRWVYAGGPPFTPLDLTASHRINRSVLDCKRVNEERYPDYHSLNLRIDRQFAFSHSALSAYFSLWNVYNRKNISMYYWNEITRKPDKIYQWSLLPLIGIEFEF